MLTALLLPLFVTVGSPAATSAWKTLQRGVEYAAIGDAAKAAGEIDGRMHVVRIDPKTAPLQAVMASAGDRRPRTAAAWCRDRKLASPSTWG